MAVYNIPFANPKSSVPPFAIWLCMENSGSSDMGGGAGNARWNPTKEQIGILEGMYKQGVRTPTAEQIQQITARLRAYGHIEGKNVFYWFQNHKARQRQRERQENLALLNRCLHHHHRPLVPPPPLHHHFPPCPSVVCRPYYVPQSHGFGVYPGAAHTQVLVPCGFKRRQRSDLIDDMRRENIKIIREQRQHNDDELVLDETVNRLNAAWGMMDGKTTLDLFPLHPMGNAKESSDLSSEKACSSFDEAQERIDEEEQKQHQPFFDFFTNKSCHD